MKQCPHCKENIKALAKKCRYCGEWLNDGKLTENGIMRYEPKLLKVAIIGLLLAVIPVWPYAFYQFVKIIVFLGAILSAYIAHKEGLTKGVWVMGAIALLFNPINPLYLGHPIWSVIDLIVAYLFYKRLKVSSFTN